MDEIIETTIISTEPVTDITGVGVNTILDFIVTVFHNAFDWFYDLIFFRLFSFTKDVGKNIFNFVFDSFSGLSANSIAYFLGIIVVILVIKLVVDIVR